MNDTICIVDRIIDSKDCQTERSTNVTIIRDEKAQ